MSKLIALLTLVSFSAYADGYAVKSGILVNEDDVTVEVDGGWYMDQDGIEQVRSFVGAILQKNDELTKSLTAANKKIVECTSYVPGLPVWASVVISVALTGLTAVAGYFSIKEATK